MTEIGKTRQFKQKKNRGGNNKNNEETQSDAILRFRPSKLNETQISAIFKDADEKEVKEYINIFQEGDPKENLITLLKQVIDIGNLYDLWKGSFKTLCQVMARSLSGKPREKWNASILQTTRNHCKEFIKVCQSATTKILGKNAFRNQEEVMENTLTLPNGKLYRDAIEQYFTINKDMNYLGEKGESFTTRVLNKQIIKMLPPRIRMEYIMNGGETKNGKEDILEAMDSLDTFVKLTEMVNASEKVNSNKNGGNQHENSKKKSSNKSNGEANHGSDNQQTSQPCKIHEGKHTWSEYLNNKFSKNYKGNNGGKPINIDGAETKKKTSFKEKFKDEAYFIQEEGKSGKGNYYDPLQNKMITR